MGHTILAILLILWKMDIGRIFKFFLISQICVSLILILDTFHAHILKGADFYWKFIGDESPIRGQGPTTVNSKLGYLVLGPLEWTTIFRVSKPKPSINLHIQAVDCDDLYFLLVP
jgi:hypothetical protein